MKPLKTKPVGPRRWLIDLGLLTTTGRPQEQDVQERILSYLTLLTAEFPPAAFCEASLAHVAQACQWFPSYSEVHQHLSAWRKQRSEQKTHDDDLHRRLVITRALELALTTEINPDHDIPNREQFLAKDWDDGPGILRKIASLADHPKRMPLLHMLASLVNKHAPQHLGMIPPDILAQWSK
jgi:hypothetical protein